MKLKIKTWEMFAQDGFKRDYPKCYRGNRKDPEASFSYHLCDAVLGKDATVLEVDKYDRGTINVLVSGKRFTLPLWMFVETVDITTIREPVEKLFPEISLRDPIKHIRGIGFEFPCSFDVLTEVQAKKVAKWIIQRLEK